MDTDSHEPPLQRRVPGAAGARPARSARQPLPDAVMARLQAVVDAAHAERESGGRDSDADALDDLAEAYLAVDPDLAAGYADAAALDESGVPGATGVPGQTGVPGPTGWDAFRRDDDPGTDVRPERAAWWEHAVESGSATRTTRPPKPQRPSKPQRAPRPQPPPKPQRSPRPERRGRSRPAIVGVVALAAVLIAAGAVALALTRPARHTVPRAGDSKAAAARAAAAARLAANVANAATWVVGQVSPTVEVACDPAMCQALVQRGFPPQRLDELGQMRANPFASTIVVATPALRHQFGASLYADWAPAVLAGFGSGSEQVTVRVMAKRGAHAYTSALRADRRRRAAVGAFLIASSQVVMTPAARSALAAGNVDARLLLAIAALASQHPIDILAFGQTWSGTSAGIPLRTADLAANNPAAYLPEPVYLQVMIGQLRLLPAAYRPVRIAAARFAGRRVLRIEFSAPSPLGLLSAYQ